MLGLIDSITDLDRPSRLEAKTYLGSFYSEIRNQKDMKWLFADGCLKGPAM